MGSDSLRDNDSINLMVLLIILTWFIMNSHYTFRVRRELEPER